MSRILSKSDVEQMKKDLLLEPFTVFDIRRPVREVDTNLGGVTVTSTAIESRLMELQNLGGRDLLALGGLRIEANYKGFTSEDADLVEEDIITSDSGTNRYQVVFIRNYLDSHVEFFAKKIS